jgi:hypothetical protein
VQHGVQQRIVDVNLAVVANEAQFSPGQLLVFAIE